MNIKNHTFPFVTKHSYLTFPNIRDKIPIRNQICNLGCQTITSPSLVFSLIWEFRTPRIKRLIVSPRKKSMRIFRFLKLIYNKILEIGEFNLI